MKREEIIQLFSKLGSILESVSEEKPYSGYETGLSQEEYESLVSLVNSVHVYNPWFTPLFVKKSMYGISTWLNEVELTKWLANYSFTNKPKRVGLIMAGNIPLVGFHDFLSVIMSGNIAVCKFSSNDNKLWPALIRLLQTIDNRFEALCEISEHKLGEIDAIIATGSDNSARYFEYYFSKYPHIIRKNRTSVAFLTGEETDDELEKLADDIFMYFGLGCRNISQLLVPKDFDIDRFFKGIYKYNEVVMNHHKYINNYDYNKAIYLLNREDVLENGFALVRYTNDLNSPLSVINCHRYETIEEASQLLLANRDKIQVIVGKGYTPFGASQTPALIDYADNIDTMAFLNGLR